MKNEFYYNFVNVFVKFCKSQNRKNIKINYFMLWLLVFKMSGINWIKRQKTFQVNYADEKNIIAPGPNDTAQNPADQLNMFVGMISKERYNFYIHWAFEFSVYWSYIKF